MALAFFCPTLKGGKNAALSLFGFALFRFFGVFGFWVRFLAQSRHTPIVKAANFLKFFCFFFGPNRPGQSASLTGILKVFLFFNESKAKIFGLVFFPSSRKIPNCHVPAHKIVTSSISCKTSRLSTPCLRAKKKPKSSPCLNAAKKWQAVRSLESQSAFFCARIPYPDQIRGDAPDKALCFGFIKSKKAGTPAFIAQAAWAKRAPSRASR